MSEIWGRGRSLRKILIAVAATGCVLASQAEAASVGCFAPNEAKEARLRQLQQDFTVAALSCGAVQAERDAVAARYNEFVGKFTGVLNDNAKNLKAHFAHKGGDAGFDSWMTKLANAAAQRAATDPSYCARVWTDLELSLALQPNDLADFAASATVGYTVAALPGEELVPVCVSRRADTAGTVGFNQ